MKVVISGAVYYILYVDCTNFRSFAFPYGEHIDKSQKQIPVRGYDHSNE